MIEKIQKENWFAYDVIIATPDMMPELGKIGKILGPKGLMPNPKTNTVTTNVAAAIEDVKKGMVSYKTDSYGNIHSVIGKVSFDDVKLQENLEYIIHTISKLKPASVKGKYINSITIASTMGPGIKLDKNSFDI
jgi:large subunit ribosomal protein L1